MKRRDLLASSVGLAGLSLSQSVGATRPCPPPSLGIGGGIVASADCAAAVATQAPEWFVNMPERTWTTVAAAADDRLRAAASQPTTFRQAGDIRDLIVAFVGGTVDQLRGQMILGCNGGHAAYSGNEMYICNVRSESPRWTRLNQPSNPIGGEATNNSLANFADGNPRSCHTYYRPVFVDGTFWLPSCDAFWNTELSSTATYAFSRTRLQWTYHGHGLPGMNLNQGGFYKWPQGPSVFDSDTRLIWNWPQFNVLSDGSESVYTIHVDTKAITRYRYRCNFGSCQAAYIPNRRMVVFRTSNGGIFTMDMTDVSTSDTGVPYVRRGNDGSTGTFNGGLVYHRQSDSLIYWHDYGANLRRIDLDSWAVTTLEPAIENTTVPGSMPPQGCHGNFNIINEMGNGQAALVLILGIDQPVHVYKLPNVIA